MLVQNKNLLRNILTFLDAKDIAMTSMTSKEMYKYCKKQMNPVYREEMNKYFLDCDSYFSRLDITGKGEISKYDSMKNECNWFLLFGNFISFKNKVRKFSAILDDEIFNALKFHSFIGKIRKINQNLETSFNSKHQIFFFDFINEENDIYDFYNNYFTEKEKNNFLRDENLPFQEIIEKFDEIKNTFEVNQNLRLFLQNAFNYNFEQISLADLNDNFLANSLILIYQYVKLFSQMTLNYIKKFKNDYFAFWKEITKRYDFFISSCLIINERFENLNVAINYLYSLLFHQEVTDRKFNLYKMLLNIFYQQVILPLSYEGAIIPNLSLLIKEFVQDEFNFAQEDKPHKPFVEDIANMFLDFECDENSIRYINSTEMKTSSFYHDFEMLLCSEIYETFKRKVDSCEITKENVLSFYNKIFTNKSYHFINKTLKSISDAIILSLKECLAKELVELFNDSISKKRTLSTSESHENEDIQKEIVDIENFLNEFGRNKYQVSFSEVEKISKDIVNSNAEIMTYLRKLYNSYYNQTKYFDKINKKVQKTIVNKRQSSTSCLIEKGKKTEDVFMDIDDVLFL